MKQKLTFALIMGLITTATVSFVIIAINVGFNQKFLMIWLRSWSVAYMLAVSSMLLIAPRIQVLVDHLFREDFGTKKDDK